MIIIYITYASYLYKNISYGTLPSAMNFALGRVSCNLKTFYKASSFLKVSKIYDLLKC